ISSDLLRAAQTARLIAEASGLTVTRDQSWRERGFGELEGKTIGQKAIWEAASGGVDAMGAEAPEACYARVRGAVAGLAQDLKSAGTIGVVTHGGPCRSILKMLSDGRLRQADGEQAPGAVEIWNCSIMRLERLGDAWKVACVNDVEHLRGMTNDEARMTSH